MLFPKWSGPVRGLLAAVWARHCQSVSHITAKSDTQVDISKVFYEMFSHFPKTLYIQQNLGFVNGCTNLQ